MNKKKRLIFVISSSIAGGGQIYLFNILSFLADRYSILLICPNGFLLNKVRSELRIDTISLTINLKNVSKLRSIIKKEINYYGNVYINAHLLGTALWTKIAISGLSKTYYTVTLHNKVLYPDMGWHKRIIYPFILKRIASSKCNFIAVSQEIADNVRQFTNKECTYIPSSVPIKEPPVAISEDITKKEIVRIGFVGRLSQLKNPIRFIEMAEIVKRQLDNTRFIIVGDGEQRLLVEECIKENHMEDCVDMKGFVSNPKAEMRNLDVLVISSDSEGTPLVLLESMSYGIPVVSTRVGAIPLVIDNEIDGILAEDLKSSSLAKSVVELLSDKEKYISISNAAYNKIKERFSYEKNISRYMDVVLKVENHA